MEKGPVIVLLAFVVSLDVASSQDMKQKTDNCLSRVLVRCLDPLIIGLGSTNNNVQKVCSKFERAMFCVRRPTLLECSPADDVIKGIVLSQILQPIVNSCSKSDDMCTADDFLQVTRCVSGLRADPDMTEDDDGSLICANNRRISACLSSVGKCRFYTLKMSSLLDVRCPTSSCNLRNAAKSLLESSRELNKHASSENDAEDRDYINDPRKMDHGWREGRSERQNKEVVIDDEIEEPTLTTRTTTTTTTRRRTRTTTPTTRPTTTTKMTTTTTRMKSTTTTTPMKDRFDIKHTSSAVHVHLGGISDSEWETKHIETSGDKEAQLDNDNMHEVDNRGISVETSKGDDIDSGHSNDNGDSSDNSDNNNNGEGSNTGDSGDNGDNGDNNNNNDIGDNSDSSNNGDSSDNGDRNNNGGYSDISNSGDSSDNGDNSNNGDNNENADKNDNGDDSSNSGDSRDSSDNGNKLKQSLYVCSQMKRSRTFAKQTLAACDGFWRNALMKSVTLDVTDQQQLEFCSTLCRFNPCLNGGTCDSGEWNYRCYCSGGYTGKNCQTLSNRKAKSTRNVNFTIILDIPWRTSFEDVTSLATTKLKSSLEMSLYNIYKPLVGVEAVIVTRLFKSSVGVDHVVTFNRSVKINDQYQLSVAVTRAIAKGSISIDGHDCDVIGQPTVVLRSEKVSTSSVCKVDDGSVRVCQNGGTCMSDDPSSRTDWWVEKASGCKCTSEFQGQTCDEPLIADGSTGGHKKAYTIGFLLAFGALLLIVVILFAVKRHSGKDSASFMYQREMGSFQNVQMQMDYLESASNVSASTMHSTGAASAKARS